MVYGEQNTINSSLEVIEQLLQSASVEFSVFLTSGSPSPCPAPNLWVTETGDSFGQLDEKSETGSQLDAPMELYFDLEESIDATIVPSDGKVDQTALTPQKDIVSSLRTGRNSPTNSIDSWAASTVSLSDDSCFTSVTGNVPLKDLVEYIQSNVLTHKRVSIKSIGLACLASSLNIEYAYINDLSVFETFLRADDPKLVSRTTSILSHLVVAELRACNLNFNECRPLVNVACERINDVLGSEVATVLKAACEYLQLCLPLLLASTCPYEGIKLLTKLVKLIDVNYWLLKVELLEALAVVDYALLAVVDSSLLSLILDDVVFPSICDSDHRVREAVAHTLTQLVRTIDTTCHPLSKLAAQHVKASFDHLYVKPTELLLAGIGGTDSQVVPPIPTGLETVVWHCMMLLGSSQDQLGQKGALEVLCRLSEAFPPPTVPNLWGVSGSQCGLLEMVLQLLRGNSFLLFYYFINCM